jgi:DNA-binding NtrC family response regulator
MANLLIVDDEPSICVSVSFALEDDYTVWTATDAATAEEIVKTEAIDCVLLDLSLGQTSGLALLPRLKAIRPELTVIMMTAYGTIESSVEAIKAGAYHYLTKPLHMDEVKLLLDKALEFQALHRQVQVLSEAVRQKQSYAGIIGKSPAMGKLFQLIEKVKDIPSSILITGESGTGKELVARAILRFPSSTVRRYPKPCWRANCSVMRKVRSRARFKVKRGFSSGRMAGRYFWMRSGKCRFPCKPSCFGSCRRESSPHWAAMRQRKWISASLPLPIASSRRKWLEERFGKTYFTD